MDLDGTLTRGGSTLAFAVHAGGWGRLPAALGRAAAAWAFGPSNRRDRAKEALVGAVVAGRDRRELEELGRSFARRLSGRLRPDVAGRLRWHLDRGHRVVVVSASLEVYVEPLARELGAEACLATRLELDGQGRATGRFLGANCRGPEKLARLEALWAGRRPQRLWAYGNSSGDAEMLAAADVAVRVRRRALPDLPEPAGTG
jgi:phosphatidylglycerophosphatase C